MSVSSPAASDPVFAALVHLAEISQDGLALIDSARRYLYVNAVACALLGAGEEELLERDAALRFPAQERTAIAACLSLDADQPRRWTSIMYHADGRECAIDFSARPCAMSGQPFVAVTMRDVTEHRRTQRRATALAGIATRIVEAGTVSESELALLSRLTNDTSVEEGAAPFAGGRLPGQDAKEADYRTIFEATFDAMTITNLNGYCVEANPAACQMYGYSYDEIIGLNAAEVTHPDSRELLRAFPEAIASGDTIEARAINLRKGDIPFHAEARGRAIQYKGQTHILSVIRDITAQVQAEEELEQRVIERTRELTALLDISRNAASTLELKPLLGLILDQLRTIIDYSGAAIHVLDGEWLVMLELRSPSDYRPGPYRTLASESRFWQSSLRHGQPVVIDDLLSDDPNAVAYRALLSEENDLSVALSYIRSYLAVPLVLKDRVIGALPISHSQTGYFTPRRQALVMAMASQIAVAIENARLYERAQQLAALEERQRLARELHDSVSQALYGIALGARTARTLLDRDPHAVAEPLGYVLELAETGLAEMRALIFELLPQALETEGLIAALRKQVAAVLARHRIDIAATLGEEPEASLQVKEALYRIAQEALHNTVKHARARNVGILLDDSGDGIVLEVRDDGVGFDSSESFPGHLGLHTMRERATQIGGSLEIASVPGAGTLVRVRVSRPIQP